MKVIREKTILQKIDDEIDKKGLPKIVRIDLDEGEFEDFLLCLVNENICTTSWSEIVGIKRKYFYDVTKSEVRCRNGKWLGSYVVYRDVCVQCCYEEE
ncbi:MAG: hypothetical protein GOVbin2917_35 [Prokaryotic dsDNA virus sp.]|jgi:hypothetical protein|nr:MAG: hypothetical protein GOVbin2917_35 [Prokaryotic dsDNA virus sp.]|tara:strand:- start:81985 stop:82278 length:294 start_codon:yes stop_codon:yes gene_type:complete